MINHNDSNFFQSFFNNFISERNESSYEYSPEEIKALYKIFIFGRSEKHFLNFLSNNPLALDQKKTLRLKKNSDLRTIKSLLIIKESFKVFQLLHEKDINFIPLKGSQLIFFYKFNITYRPLRDLDLLIKKEQLHIAVNILQKNGYFFKSNKLNKRKVRSPLSNHRYDIEPLFNKDGVCIELHFKIQHGTICSLSDSLWNNSHHQKIGKTSVLATEPELVALHLIYHSISKQGIDVGVQSLFDVYKLMQSSGFDVHKLINYAVINNLSREVALYLHIFKKYGNYRHDINTFMDSCNISNTTIDNCLKLMLYNRSTLFKIIYIEFF